MKSIDKKLTLALYVLPWCKANTCSSKLNINQYMIHVNRWHTLIKQLFIIHISKIVKNDWNRKERWVFFLVVVVLSSISMFKYLLLFLFLFLLVFFCFISYGLTFFSLLQSMAQNCWQTLFSYQTSKILDKIHKHTHQTIKEM